MARKSIDLLNAMRGAGKSAPRPGTGSSAAGAVLDRPATSSPAKEAIGAEGSEPTTRKFFRPGRAGKTNVTGYFPPPVKRQLRMLSAEHDKTIQRLLAEALNDLFMKYGKPEAAPLDDEA